MNNIAEINPLMQPVSYNGQVYFTSQYFHSQYKINAGEKYAQLPTFNRLIRSIEAYPIYLDNGDIVEIKSKKDIGSENPNLYLAYESNNYAPIMLINATAQVALTHHLDDEISKAVSVAVNDKVANESFVKIDPRYVSSTAKAMLSMAKAFGFKGNQAILSADKATMKLTGHSPLKLLDAELISDSKSVILTPTEIGLMIGGLSAQKVNKMLDELGFQHKIAGLWEATDKGKAFGEMVDTNKKHSDGVPVKQWKWFSSIVDQLSLENAA